MTPWLWELLAACLDPERYLWEALALGGLLLLTIGLGLAWPPLALIVPGVGLLAFGLYGARAWARPRRAAEEGE